MCAHGTCASVALNDIAHRWATVRSPQINGFVERCHRTVLKECFALTLREHSHDALKALQEALAAGGIHYHREMSQRGSRNVCRRPPDTVTQYRSTVRQEAEKYRLPDRTERRLPRRVLLLIDAPFSLNRTWALNLMHDTLHARQRCRTLNMLHEGNRVGLATEMGTALSSAHVVAAVEQPVAMHRTSRVPQCSKRPELLCCLLTDWWERRGILLQHTQAGKPNRITDLSRFKRTYCQDVFDAYDCVSLAQVRAETESRLVTGNTEWPHDSLGRVQALFILPRPSAPCQWDWPLSV
jgi:transposase InsO family protein